MAAKILITGAAGYIGGSIVADFLSAKNALFEKENIVAAVRSPEQAEAVSKLGITVLALDLADENAVADSVSRFNITIIIHLASAIEPKFALHLIAALGKQKKVTGCDTYFIHTSGLSAFSDSTGWPSEEIKDTGPIFDLEDQLADSFPIRGTDVTVINNAKAQGVTSFIVVPSIVYGRGTGMWNELSVVLPIYIKACISQKQVYKFAENPRMSFVHISDITALYRQMVERLLNKEPIPSGTEGYYFAIAHHVHWWEFLDRLAVTLKGRGLVTHPDVQTWPNEDFTADALGIPKMFVKPLWGSASSVVSERPRSIGWAPAWDKDRFLDNIDGEVQAVIDVGGAKSSLIDSLFNAAKG